MTYMSILLYADDILLVAPSVASLQRILISEYMWSIIRLAWYAHQSKEILVYSIWCSLLGVECRNISTSDDSKLPWSDNFRYLGV